MADVEKVISHFEDVLSAIKSVDWWGFVRKDIISDAITILKDQQKQIEQMNFIYGFVYGGQVKEIKKLVRCNECKHRDPEDHKCDCGHDIQWQLPRADDWFCADGEEK